MNQYTRPLYILSVAFLIVVLCASCGLSKTSLKHRDANSEAIRPQLVIYSGMTMAKAISEIADTFSEYNECDVLISKNASGIVMHAIEKNQLGDLFFSGNEDIVLSMKEAGHVEMYEHIGYNIAVLMVEKGNPKHIESSLSVLLDPSYHVIIGNPESGAIGLETKTILEERDLYDAVLANAKELAADSKDLTKAIVTKRADVVHNWQAAVSTYDAAATVTVLQLPEHETNRNRLMLAKLTYATQPELAKKFIEFCLTEEGQKILMKHGLGLDMGKDTIETPGE